MRPTHRFRLVILIVIALVVLGVLVVVNLGHMREPGAPVAAAQTIAAAPAAWGRS